jgi:transcription termination factor NusB
MAIFTYDINKFKFSVADMEQVRKDFSRGRQHIFINGILLEERY